MSKLIVGALIVLFISLYVLTINKVYKQAKGGRRLNPLWLLLIVFCPIIGPLVYVCQK